MIRLLMRSLVVILVGVGLSVVCAVWIAYTGDNLLSRAIMYLCGLFHFGGRRFPVLLGIVLVVQGVWRLLARKRASRRPPACLS